MTSTGLGGAGAGSATGGYIPCNRARQPPRGWLRAAQAGRPARRGASAASPAIQASPATMARRCRSPAAPGTNGRPLPSADDAANATATTTAVATEYTAQAVAPEDQESAGHQGGSRDHAAKEQERAQQVEVGARGDVGREAVGRAGRIAEGGHRAEQAGDEQAEGRRANRDRHAPGTWSASGTQPAAQLRREQSKEAGRGEEARDLDRTAIAEAEIADLHPHRVVAGPDRALDQEHGDEDQRSEDTSPHRTGRRHVIRTAHARIVAGGGSQVEVSTSRLAPPGRR